MYSNSSDSNYTNHTPSLASIYQVRHELGILALNWNLSLGETESDKKLIYWRGEIQYHIFCLVNSIVVGEKFLYFGFTLKSFFTEVMVLIPTRLAPDRHCHGLLGEPDHGSADM